MATIKLVLSTDLAKHAKIIDKWKKLSKNSLNFDDPENRTLTMQMIIKCSDISNPAKEYQAHSRWSELVIKEFYSQGDLERYVILRRPVKPGPARPGDFTARIFSDLQFSARYLYFAT